MSPDRAARKVEKVTGCTINTITDELRPVAYAAYDPELDRHFLSAVRGSSREQAFAAVKVLHRRIYTARREELYRRCGGKCQRCGMKTPRLTWHHIVFRSKGRDDRLPNAIMLCSGPLTNDCHGKVHRSR